MYKIYLLSFFLISGLVYQTKASTWHVNQNATNTTGVNMGSKLNPFKTISEAALVAQPADTVLVYAGIYRERVAPVRGGVEGKPIVYKAAEGQKVVLKGSDLWSNNWQKIEGDVFSSTLDVSKLSAYNPYFIPLATMGGRKSLGQIFCNGVYLTQVDSLEQINILPGTWMLSYDSTKIIINYPARQLNCPIELCEIEYSVRGKVFAPHKRGLGYIQLEGFTIEHSANQFPTEFYTSKGFPQSGAVSTRAGHNWTIRSNTIRFAKSLAIDCGYEGVTDNEGDEPLPDINSIGYHLIEHNIITDCGAGGIAGAHQIGSRIMYNRIDRTNNLGFTAPETGAIKVHFFYDGLVEGNTFVDNDCAAIWFDNQWYNSRISRNIIIRSRGRGIFVEMGEGKCLVDNNIVAYTRSGDGIYTHDASGVTIANNLLFANTHFGIYMRVVTERTAKNEKGIKELVATQNQKILNNIFIDNYRGAICLPMDGGRVANNISDYNLFINGTQWQWEALPYHSFAVNLSNGVKDKNRTEQMHKELWIKSGEMSEEEINEKGSEFFRMPQPLLSFESWKQITGNDKNSEIIVMKRGKVENGAVAQGSVSLSALSFDLIIQNTEPFSLLECPIVDGIDHDFYGNPYRQGVTFPGPFAEYNVPNDYLYLIPPILP